MKSINIKHSILFLPLLSLIFFSCVREPSSSVDQDSIYGEYRLVYSSDDDKTYARAEFHFGSALGTKLELSDPATVSVDGNQLAWKALFAYYERDFAGVKANGEFEYTDLDGNTFVNNVTAARPIDLPTSLDPLVKGSSYTLSWVGAALAAGESVNVTVNGPNEGDAKVFTTSDPGATSIILDADKINDLGLGTGSIIMERYQAQTLQQGTSKGGATWSRYLSKTMEIQIQE